MGFHAYILQSEKDKGYYFGQTTDLELRVKKHNQGNVKSTKGRRPLRLHYFEEYNSRKEAFAREQFFKSLEGRHWLKTNEIID